MINIQNLFYAFGIIIVTGFAVVFLVCLLIYLYRKKKGESTNDYDEK